MTDGHRTSTIARPAVTSAPRGRSTKARATKARQLDDRDDRNEERNDDHDDHDDDRGGLLKDFTTPIPRAKQIVTGGHGRLIVGVFATLIALAIAAALFVLPVKSWMKQRNDLATRSAELATLDAANAKLQSEVDRLQTDDGVREAAREEIDYVPDGEKRVTVLPVGPASTVLPGGWPYNLVTSIIAIRAAEAAATATAATSATTAVVASTATTAAAAAPGQP